jgi:hypothetical protein
VRTSCTHFRHPMNISSNQIKAECINVLRTKPRWAEAIEVSLNTIRNMEAAGANTAPFGSTPYTSARDPEGGTHTAKSGEGTREALHLKEAEVTGRCRRCSGRAGVRLVKRS